MVRMIELLINHSKARRSFRIGGSITKNYLEIFPSYSDGATEYLNIAQTLSESRTVHSLG